MTTDQLLVLVGGAAAMAAVASAVFLFCTLLVARKQLSDLNRSTQLQNFITLARETDSTPFTEAYMFVTSLRNMTGPERATSVLKDERGGDPKLDRVLNFFERIGFLSSKGYLDRPLAVEWWGWLATQIFEGVRDILDQRNTWDLGAGSELRDLVKEYRQSGQTDKVPQGAGLTPTPRPRRRDLDPAE